MRVRDPQRLAELLLAEDQGWPAQRVAAAMAPGGAQNNQINLGRKIPVHITYFTAAVDEDGKLKLFADIYDHESKIALGHGGQGAPGCALKEKAPAQAEADRQPRREHGAPATLKKDWSTRSLEIIDHLGRILAARMRARSRSAAAAPMLPHSRHSMRLIRGSNGLASDSGNKARRARSVGSKSARPAAGALQDARGLPTMKSR